MVHIWALAKNGKWESSFKLTFSHRIRSLRIHLGVCFCGTNTEGPWRKEQKPLGKTADEMRWDGGTLVLVHKAHRGRGACQFKLVVASIDWSAYPGQRQWSKHTCVSSLTEVAIDQVKDLILPPIPVDFGVWLTVLQIHHSEFFYSQELTFKSHTLEVPTYP